jgi:hypothetical protein
LHLSQPEYETFLGVFASRARRRRYAKMRRM